MALATDLYELTMAYAYWKSGLDRREAVFHMDFRKNPFGGGFALACGLGTLVEYLKDFAFDESDTRYLKTLKGSDGKPLFDQGFLKYLSGFKLEVNLDAVPEGSVVFHYEPLVRVQGPLLHCQILESLILNTINFQSLIATKAVRVCQAAGRDPVLEFGFRRAHGIDGALSASRAAHIGSPNQGLYSMQGARLRRADMYLCRGFFFFFFFCKTYPLRK